VSSVTVIQMSSVLKSIVLSPVVLLVLSLETYNYHRFSFSSSVLSKTSF
jgi:hypothetical protein